MRLAAYTLWEWLTYALWWALGWRDGKVASLHYRAESRLRREQARRAEARR